MIYVFQDQDDGSIHELYFPTSKAPKIGSARTVKGRRLVRLASMPQALVRPDAKFVSHSLPRNWPHAKDHEPGTGKPRFNSIHEVRESVSRSKDTKMDQVVYD